MVDARGGAMKGCRHSGIRIIIPPRRASMPTRITCRYVRKEKLTSPPPLNEGESLAARVLELGPQNYKFLGPVIIEIPHYASLRGKEREILILRNDNGDKWVEHPTVTTDNAIEEALGCPIEQSLLADGSLSASHGAITDDGSGIAANGGTGDKNNSSSSQISRVTRIITSDFPKYFAIITRIRQEVHAVSETGGVISSTVVPKAQAVFPEKALQKRIKLSLQAMPIQSELVSKLLGTRVTVSPIVTIEPRRRKFHKPITLTIPLPKQANKQTINSDNLRLLCSITGGYAPAQWEDITGHTPLTYVDECVSFTTTVSARFWLIDLSSSSSYNDVTRMATELYREAIAVPFVSRFVVYAKRHEVNESKVRIFCITDDKEEKTLEKRENFCLIAKSKEIEVLENRIQWLDVGGNLMPITKSDTLHEQLNFTFQAFKENRLQFVVRIKDVNQIESGRLVFFKDSKSFIPKSDIKQQPICTLDIELPVYNKDSLDAEALKRSTLSRSNLSFAKFDNRYVIESLKSYDVNLNELASHIDESKWKDLASELGLSPDEIQLFEQTQFVSNKERIYEVLNYWKSNKLHRSSEDDADNLNSKLQQALLNINFDINKLNELIEARHKINNNRLSINGIY